MFAFTSYYWHLLESYSSKISYGTLCLSIAKGWRGVWSTRTRWIAIVRVRVVRIRGRRIRE